ncbi:hypothetical protein QR680_016862 [Steinernema hermaphroditum]|uniref:Uncharacterized protein n=1 Tax=Steinernema hermaphroditum TaxID=289476 RepID=A0AA39HCI0_9BILA|nr:hypothetical protein QR680_016862 [Steinernema hermaphroditum]
MRFVVLLLLVCCVVYSKRHEDDSEEEEDKEELSEKEMDYYKFLYKRMKQSAKKRAPVAPAPYMVPGPFEPLPGRSHNGDYFPVFPFANQYSGGVDLDPSISRAEGSLLTGVLLLLLFGVLSFDGNVGDFVSQLVDVALLDAFLSFEEREEGGGELLHIGGDINIPVPTWGMLDITGRFFNRISDTTTKFGYLSHPINMLGLTKEDFTRLMSDPSLHHNRNIQPLIPLGKVPRSLAPISCRPPMCNPYTQTFAFGMEHDIGGHDGVDGDINVPIPIGKDLAYRFPIGGNLYYDLDNITVSYAHNLAPVDPYVSPVMFNVPRDSAYSKTFELFDRLSEVKDFNDAQPLVGFQTPGKRSRRSLLQPEIPYPGVPYSYMPSEVPAYDLFEDLPVALQPIFRRPAYVAAVSQLVEPNIQLPYPYSAVPSYGVYPSAPSYSYRLPQSVGRVPPTQFRSRHLATRRRTVPVIIHVLLKKASDPSRSTQVTPQDFKHPLEGAKRTKRFYSIFDPKRRLKRGV